MSCIYNDLDGKCEIYDDSFEHDGVDENGYCICDYDEDSLETCEDYTISHNPEEW